MMDAMYRLIDLESDEAIGVATGDQLQFLIDNLEKEGVEDQDYFIDEDTLSFLAENGCDEDLLTMLTEVLEGRMSIDIRYEVA
ncbi:MAG: galactosyldiacylglycerol synthase [Candidatus Poribacteria bacterium]|nr:galactosyldiacylglycerol synthase [Candidatus Poribacteria bacterium]